VPHQFLQPDEVAAGLEVGDGERGAERVNVAVDASPVGRLLDEAPDYPVISVSGADERPLGRHQVRVRLVAVDACGARRLKDRGEFVRDGASR